MTRSYAEAQCRVVRIGDDLDSNCFKGSSEDVVYVDNEHKRADDRVRGTPMSSFIQEGLISATCTD